MTRFTFTLDGYIDIDDPARASDVVGETSSLTATGETSGEVLEPRIALVVLLTTALRDGLGGRALGAHELHVRRADVRPAGLTDGPN